MGDDMGLNDGSGEEGPLKVPVLNVANDGFGEGGNGALVGPCLRAGFRGRGLFLMSIPEVVVGAEVGGGNEGVAGFSKEENFTPLEGGGADFWKI